MVRRQLLTQAACSLLLLYSVGVHSSNNIPGCPTGLADTTLMTVYEQQCFQFVSVESYWREAADNCMRAGGRLIKIGDPDTNQFILDTLAGLLWRNDAIWIGLNDKKNENTWEWVGYSANVPERANWTNWASGEPGAFLSSKKDCVRMKRDGGKWHTTFCSTGEWKYRSICQYVQLDLVSGPIVAPVLAHTPPASTAMIDRSNWTVAPTSLAVFRPHESNPKHGSVKAEEEVQKQSNHQFWIIIAGASIISIILLAILAFVIISRRRHCRKKQAVDADNPSQLFPTPACDNQRSNTRAAETNIRCQRVQPLQQRNNSTPRRSALNAAISQSSSSIKKAATPTGYSFEYTANAYPATSQSSSSIKKVATPTGYSSSHAVNAYPEHAYLDILPYSSYCFTAPPPPHYYESIDENYEGEYLCPMDLMNQVVRDANEETEQCTPEERGRGMIAGQHVSYSPRDAGGCEAPYDVGYYSVIPADAN